MLKKGIRLSVAIMVFVVASIVEGVIHPAISMAESSDSGVPLSGGNSPVKRSGKAALERDQAKKEAKRYEQAVADYAQGLKYFNERTAYDKAFELFKRAASVNHSHALFYVGVYHEFGLGVVEESLDEAAQWYTKALSGPEVCEEALPGLKRVIQKKAGRI